MSVWLNSSAEIFHSEDGPRTDCEVRIDGDEIVVSYEDDGRVIYRGQQVGPGHFNLKCPERGGSATLHRSPGVDFIEGFWTEGGTRGMWRITLDDGRE